MPAKDDETYLPKKDHIQSLRPWSTLSRMLSQVDRRASRLPRWFLFSGSIGLGIAIILADLLSHDLMAHDLGSTALLKLLWPASVMSGAAGSNVAAQMLDGLLMYGGQFVLYGCFGLLIAVLVRGLSGRHPQRKA